MEFQIALMLVQDGITNGAIYALLALALVLVFAVTRVIFIQQGEFVAYGALTLAIFQTGQVPGTVWLLFLLATVAALMELVTVWRHQRHATPAIKSALLTGLPALVVGLLSLWAAPHNFPLLVQALLSLAIVTVYGPLIYRVAYQSLAGSSTLVLLIVSVGVHFAMIGLGLLFDTFVVRSLITPSIAALLGRWFWWPQVVRPRPARHWPKADSNRQLPLWEDGDPAVSSVKR